MASRRRLKKSIKLICSELFADCVALSMCGQATREKSEQHMAEILAIHSDFVSRISHTQKGAEKLFYKKLRAEFTEKVNALSESIIKS